MKRILLMLVATAIGLGGCGGHTGTSSRLKASVAISAGGPLKARRDWTSGVRKTHVDDDGYYRGAVDPNESWAMLWWGGICVSGGPSNQACVL